MLNTNHRRGLPPGSGAEWSSERKVAGHGGLPGIRLGLPIFLAVAGEDGSADPLPRVRAGPGLVAAAAPRHDGHSLYGLHQDFPSRIDLLCPIPDVRIDLLELSRHHFHPGDLLFLPGRMLHSSIPSVHGHLSLTHLARRGVPFFPGPHASACPDSHRERLYQPVAVTLTGTNGRIALGVRLVASRAVRSDHGAVS